MRNVEKALLKSIERKVEFEEVKELNPENLDTIKAIVYDGIEYNGKMTQVFAYYGKPKIKKSGEKLPAILLIHGGGGYAFASWVKEWNDRGYIAIALSTVGSFPDNNKVYNNGNADFWKTEVPEILAHRNGIAGIINDEMKNADKSLEHQWLFHATSAAILAHNILIQDEDTDKSKIGVTGISWGGVITSLIIGYDNRFAFAIPVYSSGYLIEGLGHVDARFFSNSMKELWLAEKRFDKVFCPVMWTGSNDDRCFSLQPKSKSYLDTVINNEETRLCIIKDMKHSHEHGWAPVEIARYANSIIGTEAKLPKLSYNLSKENFQMDIQLDNPAEEKIKSITVYYLKEKMKYVDFVERIPPTVEKAIVQDWFTIDCGTQSQINKVLPADLAEYYVEIITEYKGEKYTSTSTYFPLN